MTEKNALPESFPGLTVSEIQPRTFHMKFTHYYRDGEANTSQARHYLDKVKQVTAKHPGQKLNFINDTSALPSAPFLTRQALQAYQEAYSHPQVQKVAMVGMDPILKGIVTLLARFSGRTTNSAFFGTLEEGLAWINKKRPAASGPPDNDPQ